MIETRDETAPFVLFGVRACDARSFEILDKVFLAEPVDTYYQARREHGTIVTMACSRPERDLLLRRVRHRRGRPGGRRDLLDRGRRALLAARTPKRAKCSDREAARCWKTAANEAVAAQQEATREILKKLPLAEPRPDQGFGGEQDEGAFQRAPNGSSSLEACLGCGTCTFVCPTCQCYDIQRVRHAGKAVQPLPLLGQLHVLRLHQDVRRTAAPDAAGALPPAVHAQAGLLPGQQRRLFRLRRLRPLRLAKCPIHMNIVKVVKTLGGARSMRQ